MEWRPQWDIDQREPAWASSTAGQNWHNPFGDQKYLWGNTPAIDILHLEEHEGADHQDNVKLLFAASGDLRNVVKTVEAVPTTFAGRVLSCINDQEFLVVARNVCLLLFALGMQHERQDPQPSEMEDDAEALIHLWYSAFLPADVLSLFQTRVLPMIGDVCDRITSGEEESTLGQTWHFPSGATLKLVLMTNEWVALRDFLSNPPELSRKDAHRLRAAVYFAPEREDYRHRWYFNDETPFMRIAKQRFREDGLLLPFGHPRGTFTEPNPLLFTSSQKWPMDDKADPLTGWSVWDVHRVSSAASQDAYGKLFKHLRGVILSFLKHINTGKADFEIYCLDIKNLSAHLTSNAYNRIEVPNVSDAGYLGIRATVQALAPLLQPRHQNPHATLITLFLNAVMEVVKMGDERDSAAGIANLSGYLPFPQLLPAPSSNDPFLLRLWDARSLVLEATKYFEQYERVHRFDQVARDLNVKKVKNHITEAWPTRLKLRKGQTGYKEEFNVLLGSNLSGLEHYVEWQRYD
ncbi:uncharacterized protein HMPREF1541_00035 [Cyphellophora europaea CBS 101466]|uniref:DUF4470 domain-containing protein n=1 Tax=Cyphellophora europaea (strain CBS 101466) TaxID=1220924 RepID=W2SD71_CYPE1|nr:uncharacterized protein HMPREF1541_00035 [Cyphellophora europaea CBS 101466]ETN45854.1 hypothetical protein HMPREF1541_00035 [Cyphellophora europaea CBS 101466]